MPIIEAIVLGIVQALTEFLPVSSSGHLHLTRWVLGWDDLSSDAEQAFDVAVHLGTLVGAMAYLWSDVKRYVGALLKSLKTLPKSREITTDARIGWALFLSTLPAGFIGGLFGSDINGWSNTWIIAVALIVFGVLLWLSDRCEESNSAKDFSFTTALLMGAAQALALQPGVSRSGVTLTMARLLKFRAEPALRLVFLMSLPIIAAAGIYGLIGLNIPSGLWPALAWGVASSAIVGWFSVWLTTKLVAQVGFKPFVIYRITLGATVLGALAL